MKQLSTFADVNIIPRFSTVPSRESVSLAVNRPGFPYVTLPVISANMDTVTESEMSKAMVRYGAQACLHRFYSSIEDNVKAFEDSTIPGFDCRSPLVSIGLGMKELERAEALRDAGAMTFIIDVNHGANIAVVNQAKQLREILGRDFGIIVGNFATGNTIETFLEHVSTGIVDGFKIGIGPGCLAAGTRVLMGDGTYKDIEKIQIHDKVINKNGRSVEVVGVKFSGFRKTFRLTNNLFHKETNVTPDHRYWVGDYSTIKNIDDHSIVEVLSKPDRCDESKIKWKSIEECNKATLLLPKNIKFEMPESFEINMEDFAVARRTLDGLTNYKNIVPSYELGYVFGTFLGDGCAVITKSKSLRKNGNVTKNTSGNLQWYFGLNETDIAEKLARCIKTSFGFDAKIQKTKNMNLVINRNNCMSRFFLQFGKRKDKHLPYIYYCGNKEYIKGILDGLVDSDGHMDEGSGRICFGNTSTVLSEQYGVFFNIINGYFPSITIKGPSKGGIGPDGNIIKGKLNSFISRSVKRPEFNSVKNYQINRIRSLEETQVLLPTYDIQVDCETSSFIANNAIVHNSICSTREKTGVGIPQFSALLDCRPAIEKAGLTMIADGGMKTAGDVCKAIGAGAHFAMTGGMLAGCEETPGELFYIDGMGYPVKPDTFLAKQIRPDGTYDLIRDEYSESFEKVKKYRGSASKESYEKQGKVAKHRTTEGESFLVPYKGPVSDVLQDIEGGLRGSMSMVGAYNIEEYHRLVEFVVVSHASSVEAGAHNSGKKI